MSQTKVTVNGLKSKLRTLRAAQTVLAQLGNSSDGVNNSVHQLYNDICKLQRDDIVRYVENWGKSTTLPDETFMRDIRRLSK